MALPVLTHKESATPVDDKLTGILNEGHGMLASGNLEGAEAQFHKASGVKENAPEALFGLALVAYQRAELSWWATLSAPKDHYAAFVGTEERGRQAIDRALGATTTAQDKAELRLHRQRLAAMRYRAAESAGNDSDARVARASLAKVAPTHPLVSDAKPASAPAASSSADTIASAAATASASAKPQLGAWPSPTRRDFEFDHEPVVENPHPNELTIPKPEPTFAPDE